MVVSTTREEEEVPSPAPLGNLTAERAPSLMLTPKLSGHTISTMRFSNSLITRPRAAEVLAKVEITLMFLPHNPLHIITKVITSTLLAESPIRTDRTIVALLGETKEGTITNIITPTTTTITQDTIVEEIIRCNI